MYGRSAFTVATNSETTERFRITSGGESKFTVGTNKYVKIYAASHNDEANLGAGIAFSRPSDGADMLSGMFAHSDTGLGIAARDHVTILTGGTSTVSDTEERFRITSNGNVGVNTDNPGLQAWRSGKILDIHGGAGNVTGELHIGANRGDGAQSVGSINFYDNTQDSAIDMLR